MFRSLSIFVLAVLLCASTALAVGPNVDHGEPYVGGQHVLSDPGDLRDCNILYGPSEGDDAYFRSLIADLTGGVVDYFDARYATPSLDLLMEYDCVLVWANYAFYDNVGYGDVLADYVDAGGRVVCGSFCTYTSGNYLSGRIMTSAYCPVYSPSGSNHFASAYYSGDGTTCIHDGVTTYECTYRDYLALQGAGIQDGSYTDGEIAHAYRPDYAVVYSNGCGASQLGCTGEWPLLIANICCGCGSTPVESTTWGGIKAIFK